MIGMLVRDGSVDRTLRWDPEPENCDGAAGRAGTGRPSGRSVSPAPGGPRPRPGRGRGPAPGRHHPDPLPGPPPRPRRPLGAPPGPGPVGRDQAGGRAHPAAHRLPSLVAALEQGDARHWSPAAALTGSEAIIPVDRFVAYLE